MLTSVIIFTDIPQCHRVFSEQEKPTGASVIKLFYGRNLQIFVISWSVCPLRLVHVNLV